MKKPLDPRVIKQITPYALSLGLDPERALTCRHWKYSTVRQAYAYVLRQKGWTFQEIGRRLNLHHTTIIYSVDQFPNTSVRNPLWPVVRQALKSRSPMKLPPRRQK